MAKTQSEVCKTSKKKREIKQAVSLTENKGHFRLVFEKSLYPALLLDGDTFIDCNDAALKLIGCQSKIGRSDAIPGIFAHPSNMTAPRPRRRREG